MTPSRFNRPALILLVGILLSTSAAPGALAAPNGGAPENAAHPQDPIHVPVSGPPGTVHVGALEGWTPERMAAAIPHPGIQRLGTPKMADDDTTLLANGPAGVVQGNLPGAAAHDAESRTLKRSGTGKPVLTYPFAFDKFAPSKKLKRAFPASTNGRLFFKQNGIDYSCSGTSVASGVGGNENLVLTAGHCLNTGGSGVGNEGTYSTDITFVPGYRSGTEPFGHWDFYHIQLWGDWYTFSDLTFDYGFVNFHNKEGISLSDAVGAQGIAWNQPKQYVVTNLGYPGLPPYNGKILRACVAPVALRDASVVGAGESPVGMGCDFTEGSSGGSWLVNFDPSNPSYVNSVNSYIYPITQPLAIYGPYFDGEVLTLWNYARFEAP